MTVTFHGDPAVKEQLLSRIAEHERLDRIVQGAYWEVVDGEWKGCAVGCSLHDVNDRGSRKAEAWDAERWHAEMELVLGIPAWLADLEDEIFEGLSTEDARGWPRRFSEAVPIGVELGQEFANRLSIARLEALLLIAPTWFEGVREPTVAALRGVIDELRELVHG